MAISPVVSIREVKQELIWDGQMVDRSLDMLKVHSFLGYVKLNSATQ